MFVDIFRNMNHIQHPFVITVTVLFFIFTLTGIIVGKFFRINSWILFIPYLIVFILTFSYYVYQFKNSYNVSDPGFVFSPLLFPMMAMAFMLAFASAIAYLVNILIFRNRYNIFLGFGIMLAMFIGAVFIDPIYNNF
jgi:hypothetical protein